MRIENRNDCESFEPKQHINDCGDCQTDGHYLCAGCKHIASFDQMETYDNRITYYEKQQIQKDIDDELLTTIF